MNSKSDNERLAILARNVDGQALAILVERIRIHLFAQAYADLRHYEDAQDAVAAALLQVCIHIGDLKEPEKIHSWIRSILRNECRQLRRGSRAFAYNLSDWDDLERWEVPPLESRSVLRLDIERALRQMPGPQARAIQLYYLEGLPISEIARLVGRPPGTVRYWLHLGRHHLARTMADYAPETAAPHPGVPAGRSHDSPSTTALSGRRLPKSRLTNSTRRSANMRIARWKLEPGVARVAFDRNGRWKVRAAVKHDCGSLYEFRAWWNRDGLVQRLYDGRGCHLKACPQCRAALPPQLPGGRILATEQACHVETPSGAVLRGWREAPIEVPP